MAKFVITLSDVGDESVEMTAKNYGNEKMKPPTPAQEIGSWLIANYQEMQMEVNYGRKTMGEDVKDGSGKSNRGVS